MRSWVAAIGVAIAAESEFDFAVEHHSVESGILPLCSNHSHGSADECPAWYECSICMDLVESLHRGEAEVCHKYNSCAFLNASTVGDVAEFPSGELCEALGFCETAVSGSGLAASPVNLRISKGLGSRGYNYIRVSVITSAHATGALLLSDDDSSAVSWSYQSQFKERWYQYYLQTAVVPFTPGRATTLNVNGHQVDVKIPGPSEGSVGLLVADPCIIRPPQLG
mmetsp:Transcript_4719/g.10010  ORF Transcript_4719/g.10010 Transcript_4719/m.10010 type:complete len:224 (+) Transcript_4719:68-739(+)